jgi:hypothetical protein
MRGLGRLLAVTALLGWLWCCPASEAGWLPPVTLEQSSSSYYAPLVSFAGNGSAVVAYGRWLRVYAPSRAAGSSRNRESVRVGRTSGFGPTIRMPPATPVALAFVNDGRIVVLNGHFVPNTSDRPSCCYHLELWWVGRRGRPTFGGTVAPLASTVGGSLTSDGHGNLLMLTTDGPSGALLRELRPGAKTFGPASTLPGVVNGFAADQLTVAYPPPVPIAADGTGGIFVGWFDVSHVWWNYRTAGGPLGAPHQAWSFPPGWVPALEPVEAAADRTRRAVALEVDQVLPSEPIPPISQAAELEVSVGNAHGFASPVTLAAGPEPLLDGPAGLYIDPAGRVTVAWTECADLEHCSVQVATRNRDGMFTQSGAFGLAPPPLPGGSLGFMPLTFWIAPVLAGDRRGDLVLAWRDQLGLYAAIRTAGRSRFGRAVRISPRIPPPGPGLQRTGPPFAAFGPKGKAIVTWSQFSVGGGGAEMAAVYQLGR